MGGPQGLLVLAVFRGKQKFTCKPQPVRREAVHARQNSPCRMFSIPIYQNTESTSTLNGRIPVGLRVLSPAVARPGRARAAAPARTARLRGPHDRARRRATGTDSIARRPGPALYGSLSPANGTARISRLTAMRGSKCEAALDSMSVIHTSEHQQPPRLPSEDARPARRSPSRSASFKRASTAARSALERHPHAEDPHRESHRHEAVDEGQLEKGDARSRLRNREAITREWRGARRAAMAVSRTPWPSMAAMAISGTRVIEHLRVDERGEDVDDRRAQHGARDADHEPDVDDEDGDGRDGDQ